MAANYQIELTPEADFQTMINNQFNQHEESQYSHNQYADPVEMIASPRGIGNTQISAIED